MTLERRCEISGELFSITDEDLQFYADVSPSAGGKKIPVPPPRLSPVERERRRLSFRNLRHLYHRTCDLTGRRIVSMFAPDSKHKVYYSEDWWSDRWDPRSYGRKFDYNRPFFEQFAELFCDVPQLHAYVILSENCEYINGAANCKSCYLSYNIDYCEQCLYVTNSTHAISCVDSLTLSRCELCYECIDCQNCYQLQHSERCIGCSDSAFLFDCRQCRNCIGCCNLVNQENCLFNRKVSPQEIAEAREFLSRRSGRSELALRADGLRRNLPRRHNFGYANESSTGNNIHHAKNCRSCFESFEIENCSYCNYVFQSNNCMDYDIFGDHSQWIYECLATGLNATNSLFCIGCWGGSADNLYCHTMSASSSCFGCCSLRQAKNCILNLQYGEDEYQRELQRIVAHMQQTGEWGEFFPARISPFAYNESIAHEYFPLSQSETSARGLAWRNRGEKSAAENPYLPPETIAEAAEDIAGRLLRCGGCGSNYKIAASEFSFYRTNNIPLPLNCPECRHAVRRRRAAPFRLWSSNCARCGAGFDTPLNPAEEKNVLCEECYRGAVFGAV